MTFFRSKSATWPGFACDWILFELFVGDVTWRPPTATGLPSKEKASFFRKQRQGSKDDCSLPSTSKLMKHSMKSEEELNKFVRRGSFEGHRSYFARIKQGIKGTKTTRSKSIDHTKYGLKGSNLNVFYILLVYMA